MKHLAERKTARRTELRWLSFLLVGGFAVAVVPPARAEQFVLVDEVFTFTKAEADKDSSHKWVRKVTQPSLNWLAPVDYRNGFVHLRTQVLDKPSGGEITQWSICYFGNAGGYGCADSGPYTAKGEVLEHPQKMATFWQNEKIDWSKGIKEVAFVMKDKDEGGGHTHKRKDPEKFFPARVRITMVQVSNGGSYDKSLIPSLAKPPRTSTPPAPSKKATPSKTPAP